MIDFEKEFGNPGQLSPTYYGSGQVQIATTFKLVYGWMCAGLAASGVVAWYTAASGLWQRVLMGPGMFACVIAELALVFILSLTINKLPVIAAYAMFAAYAIINGLTLSVVFIAYELAMVQRVFLRSLIASIFSFVAPELIASHCGCLNAVSLTVY